MTYVKKRTLCFCTLFIALLMAMACGKSLAEKPAEKANSKPKPRFTISKETTVITEPLRPDGYPDYVEALNRRFREGVTPENNSAVLFWQAVGPSEIRKEDREKYFQMLGIPPLPEKGNYLTSYEKYLTAEVERIMKEEQSEDEKRKEEIKYNQWDVIGSARIRPWSRKELPWLAEWLDANEKPLAMLVESCNRPCRYDPLIGKYAIYTLLHGPGKSREIAGVLVTRAMLRVKEGKVNQAWQDIMACHKFARLVGQGPTLHEIEASLDIESMAHSAEMALLENVNLTAAQIAAMRADLARLSPMPKIVNKFDEGGRFELLDCITAIPREGLRLDTVYYFSIGEEPDQAKRVFEEWFDDKVMASVNWDIVLRMGNSLYDQFVVAMKKSTRAERCAALTEIDVYFHKEWKQMEKVHSLGDSLSGKPRKVISERVGWVILLSITPALHAAINEEDRSMVQTELNDLAFALAAYRADNGDYPAKLEELVPKYIKAIRTQATIKDIELRYSRHKNGYLLYSFGLNGVDDGGKGLEELLELENRSGENWDDIAVRVPSRD